MLSPIKLDTFVLKDKFNLSTALLNDEAQMSASKRAEVMGWEVTQVKASDKAIERDGEYKCYYFDIWGFENGGASESKSQQKEEQKNSYQEKIAAKDAVL